MKKLIIAFGLLITSLAIYAASVTLAWDPSPDAGVSGYRIYMGPASRVYTNSYTVGNVTTAQITGLLTNRTYYFAATAYTPGGVESDFSNEVNYAPPGNGGGTNQPSNRPARAVNIRRVQP